MANRENEKLLGENICENPGQVEELGLGLHEQDYIKKIKELQVYLDTVHNYQNFIYFIFSLVFLYCFYLYLYWS